MWMLFRLAWRNVFRNKRRTLLSGLAIGVGLASLMFADSVIISLSETMIRAATEKFSGNAQIHYKGFIKNFEVEKVIVDNSKLLFNLGKEVSIKSYAPRVVGYGMLTSTFDANNVVAYGINPAMEKNISKISSSIVEGNYLDIQDQEKILIGTELAENLNIKVGDKVVLTVARAGVGDLSQEMFHVGGIFSFGVREIDQNVIFLNLASAQKVFNIGNTFHEISIIFKDINLPLHKNFPLAKKYSQNGNELLGWNKMFKDLDAILHFTQYSLRILALILFSIIALGIMNTVFMSLYERMFEFGVLRAVATRPSTVAMMILLETFMLAIISTAIGISIGSLFIYFFSNYGIDFRGIEYAHVVFRDKIYPHFRLVQFVLYPPCLIIFSMFVGLYPAIYAARIIPAKAFRKNY